MMQAVKRPVALVVTHPAVDTDFSLLSGMQIIVGCSYGADDVPKAFCTFGPEQGLTDIGNCESALRFVNREKSRGNRPFLAVATIAYGPEPKLWLDAQTINEKELGIINLVSQCQPAWLYAIKNSKLFNVEEET